MPLGPEPPGTQLAGRRTSLLRKVASFSPFNPFLTSFCRARCAPLLHLQLARGRLQGTMLSVRLLSWAPRLGSMGALLVKNNQLHMFSFQEPDS